MHGVWTQPITPIARETAPSSVRALSDAGGGTARPLRVLGLRNVLFISVSGGL